MAHATASVWAINAGIDQNVIVPKSDMLVKSSFESFIDYKKFNNYFFI